MANLTQRLQRNTRLLKSAAAVAVAALSLEFICYAVDNGSRDCRSAPILLPGNDRLEVEREGSRSHSVRLYWDASMPADNLPEDRIWGYLIERKEIGKDTEFKPINRVPIRETSCTDYAVEVNHTYVYRARAVTFRFLTSKPSNRATAVIRPR